MTKRLEYPRFQAFDVNGDPLSGGLVYTYYVGTITLYLRNETGGAINLANLTLRYVVNKY